jgi:hypothetical protein
MYAVTSCGKASAGSMRQHATNSASSHQQQGAHLEGLQRRVQPHCVQQVPPHVPHPQPLIQEGLRRRRLQ